ncbi:MAG: HEAT repeat domain-containing protein [Planctomycetes bacterium]|nr:HEAT repeat domain-containing protein [Planctomycetota bacterium]
MKRLLVVGCWFLVVSLWIVFSGCTAKVTSNEQSATSKKPSPPATGYALLIEQLGNDDWEKRDAAEKELITLLMPDAPDFTLITETNKTTANAEIKSRTERIIRYVTVKPYLSEHIREETPEIWDRLSKDDSQERLNLLYDITGDNFSIPRQWTPEELKNLPQAEPAKYIRKVTDDEKALIIKGLLKGISEPSTDLKYAFLGAAGRYYTTVILADIIPLFNDEDKDIKKQVAQALPNLRVETEGKNYIAALTKLLDHKKANIRVWAAIALVESGAKDKVTQEVIKEMKSTLDNETGEYRKRLESALNKLGAPKE